MALAPRPHAPLEACLRRAGGRRVLRAERGCGRKCRAAPTRGLRSTRAEEAGRKSADPATTGGPAQATAVAEPPAAAPGAGGAEMLVAAQPTEGPASARECCGRKPACVSEGPPAPGDVLCSRLLEPPVAGRELVAAIAAICETLAVVGPKKDKARSFRALHQPSISIEGYLQRLHTYCQCSEACFMIALVHIDRIAKLRPDFEVSNLTMHRLLAATLVVSAKFLDDTYYSNAYYAKVCGLSLRELNSLESEVLEVIGWRLGVGAEEFEGYCGRVLRTIHGELGCPPS